MTDSYELSRPSGDQTPVRLDDRLQVFRECGYCIGRHRTCPSDSEETILARARPISKFRVAKAALGASTRVVLPRGSPKPADLRVNRSGTPISSPVMHRFRRKGSRAEVPQILRGDGLHTAQL